MRPDRRPTEAQRASVRAELHARVDEICDAWSTIEAQARDLAPGYPTGSTGTSDIHGGRGGDPVGTMSGRAVDITRDPPADYDEDLDGPWPTANDVEQLRTRHREWLADVDEMRGHVLRVARGARGLLPPAAAVRAVERCSVCGSESKDLRNVDGARHCPACAKRKRRAS